MKNRIRKIRKAQGLSLTQLTQVTGIPTATLYRYETGSIARISHQYARVIADALGVPVDELFPREEATA